MKTYNTFLPIFNGFYNSIFEADGEDEEIQHINEEREKIDLEPIEYDDCKWDYKEYNLRVSERCVEVIEEELNDILDVDIKVTFESLQSPKYYNFAEYIKERYSSYDGFMSFMSNDSDVWVEDINNGEDLSHRLGAVLNFILVNEGYTTSNLYNGLDEEKYIVCINYNELINGENFPA